MRETIMSEIMWTLVSTLTLISLVIGLILIYGTARFIYLELKAYRRSLRKINRRDRKL